MWPILLCSIVALAIVCERLWSLQTKRIAPKNLVSQVWQWDRGGQLDAKRIQDLRRGSPLGRLLAAGLANRQADRAVMKEAIEEVGHHVVHELQRYLVALGTIAAISPLLGLLGTVLGMIQMFSVINTEGLGNAGMVAGGIAQALLTTVFGLIVAIPALIFHRYFLGHVDDLVMTMQQEALKMVEVMHGQREREQSGAN